MQSLNQSKTDSPIEKVSAYGTRSGVRRLNRVPLAIAGVLVLRISFPPEY
jgi:hypothetical protein